MARKENAFDRLARISRELREMSPEQQMAAAQARVANLQGIRAEIRTYGGHAMASADGPVEQMELAMDRDPLDRYASA